MKTLLTLITLFVLMTQASSAKILEAKQLFNKDVVEVIKKNIHEQKTFYGNTAVSTSAIEDVVVRFDGYITNLNASKDYMLLKKGEPLFSVYSNEVQTIQKELHIVKSINEKLYESAYEKLIALDIDNKMLQKIKSSSKVLDEVSFYTPFNALVLKRNINKGSFAKKGQLLLQLANIDQLWFIAKVYQNDVASLKEGMKALVKIDGVEHALKTRVDFVYPYLDEKSQTVDVRFVVQNHNLQLRPNMFGKAQVMIQSKEALVLPKTAVITKGDKHYVFLFLSQQEYEPIEVTAKRISSSEYEIISGVKEGEKVINNALFLLDSDAVTNALYKSGGDDWDNEDW